MRIDITPDRAGQPLAQPLARPPARRARGFVLLWLSAVLLPGFGVAGTAAMSWRDVRRDAAVRLDRNVEMLRQHALRAFGMQEAILAALSRAIAGRDWDNLREDARLHGLMTELVAAGQPLVRGVLVADGTGHVVAASYEFPARPADLSDRDYVAELHAGGGLAVGQVVESRPLGWTLFPVARRAPPRNDSDAARGVIVGSFNPDPLSGFYASVAEAPRDVVALLRLDGAVLARHPPMPDPARAAPQPWRAALIAAALARPAEQPPLAERSSVDGVRRIFVARQVGEWPVAVLYGLDEEALRASWRQRMVAPLLSGLAACLLLLGLTGLAQRGARRQQLAAEERAAAERKLASASRVASLGLLAAGLAHDVKNLVQAVRSGARLMEQRADDPAEVKRCAGLLADAAERGRRLVVAMLAFASGGTPDGPEGLDVPQALRALVELLSRTLGSGWRVAASLPAHLPLARGDRAGFEAAVVNLAVNARDAMPGGGQVRIAARLAEDAPGAPGPGRYLVVAVTDTGTGMDAATLARLGEPFFTTKDGAGGTGLGLASVRGFCERAGGALRIDSTPGQGTTAALWLPAMEAAPSPAPGKAPAATGGAPVPG
ncbi:hybrid sensor histidine kinase/response regulator [Falsiroseomonas selenitidurans]|uniref:histidine kinase n=1 Tax=Falsiroseomonas selenitidurans TaxID=2716335 RepID=A0ABX1E2U9_9PROT|nr:hybrid sensor histidine kinase/response regulator [Falsiroseomonas selenitidurans]NKC30143.1 hypothetical protein [Falsiroseomonas selenitidurans]